MILSLVYLSTDTNLEYLYNVQIWNTTLIFQLDVIKDRPSRFYLNLLAKNFQEWYMDAFFVESKWPESLAEWLDILSARTIQNLKELWWLLHRTSLEAVLLNVLFWPPFLALVALRWVSSLRNFIAAYILMAFIMFASLSVLYVWDSFTGVRLLLMLFPLEVIVVACAFDYWCRILSAACCDTLCTCTPGITLIAHKSGVCKTC